MAVKKTFPTAPCKIPVQIMIRRQLWPGKHLCAILASGRPLLRAPAHAQRLVCALRDGNLSGSPTSLGTHAHSRIQGLSLGVAPLLRRLTDGDSKEVKVQCSRFVVALDKSYEAVTLTYSRTSGYFPNFNC